MVSLNSLYFLCLSHTEREKKRNVERKKLLLFAMLIYAEKFRGFISNPLVPYIYTRMNSCTMCTCTYI